MSGIMYSYSARESGVYAVCIRNFIGLILT